MSGKLKQNFENIFFHPEKGDIVIQTHGLLGGKEKLLMREDNKGTTFRGTEDGE